MENSPARRSARQGAAGLEAAPESGQGAAPQPRFPADWSRRWPKQPSPRRPIPAIVPYLAVEVISETNTWKEMTLKLGTYFEAGVWLVWIIDPATRDARSYTSLTKVLAVPPGGSLDGGDVLPGFSLSLKSLFEEADRQGPTPAP